MDAMWASSSVNGACLASVLRRAQYNNGSTTTRVHHGALINELLIRSIDFEQTSALTPIPPPIFLSDEMRRPIPNEDHLSPSTHQSNATDQTELVVNTSSSLVGHARQQQRTAGFPRSTPMTHPFGPPVLGIVCCRAAAARRFGCHGGRTQMEEAAAAAATAGAWFLFVPNLVGALRRSDRHPFVFVARSSQGRHTRCFGAHAPGAFELCTHRLGAEGGDDAAPGMQPAALCSVPLCLLVGG